MKDLNLTMDRLINRWWKLPILVFSLLVLGIFFTPAKSVAQAVPPRSQTLQLIRPLVPPPEPPLEKKVRKNKQNLTATEQQVQKNKIEVQTLKVQQSLGGLSGTPKPFSDERGSAQLRQEISFLNSRIRTLEQDLASVTQRLKNLEDQRREKSNKALK